MRVMGNSDLLFLVQPVRDETSYWQSKLLSQRVLVQSRGHELYWPNDEDDGNRGGAVQRAAF